MKTNTNTWTVTKKEQKSFIKNMKIVGFVKACNILIGNKFEAYTKQLGPDKAKELLVGRIRELKLYRSIAVPKYKSDYDEIIAFGEQLMK